MGRPASSSSYTAATAAGGGGGGGSIANAIIWFGAGDVSPTTTTRYLYPGYDDDLGETTNISLISPISGTLSDLYVLHNTTAGNGSAIVYTVRINGVASALSVSLASTSGTGSDLVSSIAVAAGDEIDIEVTKAADVGTSPSDIVVSMRLEAAAGGSSGIEVEDEGVSLGGGPFSTLNFTGAGVTATDAGGGVADVTIPGGAGSESTVFLFGAGAIGATTTTRYLFPGGDNGLAQTVVWGVRAPVAGTLSDLYIEHNNTTGNGLSVVYTIRVNTVASLVTVTLASTTSTGSDVANSVAVAAGDIIDIEVTKAAGIGNGALDVVASFKLV